jgi:hypothetical protein
MNSIVFSIISFLVISISNVNCVCTDSRNWSPSSLFDISVPNHALRAYSREFTLPSDCAYSFIDTVAISGKIIASTTPSSFPFDVLINGGGQDFQPQGSFSITGAVNQSVAWTSIAVTRDSQAIPLAANTTYQLIVSQGFSNNRFLWAAYNISNSNDTWIQFPDIAPPLYDFETWTKSQTYQIAVSFTFVPAPPPTPGN